MAFEIEQTERDGVVILRLNGRLLLGEAVEQTRSLLDGLAAQSKWRLVLDMREVDYIDSSGLGCLVMQHTKAQKAGGIMVLFGLNQRQIDLLVITKLVTIFRIEDTEIDAISACFPDRETKPFDILTFVESQKKKDTAAE